MHRNWEKNEQEKKNSCVDYDGNSFFKHVDFNISFRVEVGGGGGDFPDSAN